MGTLVYIHGRGHKAPRKQIWRDGLAVGLSRAGYDVDPTGLESISRAATYAAFLNPGVTIDKAPHPQREAVTMDAARIALEDRNEEVRSRIGPGLPLGAKGKVIGRLSRQQGITDQLVKQKFADVARYLDEEDRRRRILTEIRQQLPTQGHVILIGHSLGSIIALDLLRDWPSELQIDVLLTMGSPAGLSKMQAHLREFRDYLPADQIGVWINAFDSDDPITGGNGLAPIYGDLVVDHHVENGGMRDNHDVDRYLEHVTLSLIVGPRIADYLDLPEPKPVRLPEDPVQAAAWLDRALGCRLRDELVARAKTQQGRAGRLLAREQLRGTANRAFDVPPATNLADHVEELASGLPSSTRLKVLIQLRATRPFAPFDLDVDEGDELLGALVSIAEDLGCSAQLMQDVHHAVSQAAGAQDSSRKLGAALVSGVAAVAVAVATSGVGLAAAPGLAGAAAISSGLSGLGALVGGSMAAGLFVTAGAGAASSGLALAALRMLDPGQTLDEVVKVHAEALVHRWEDRPARHDDIRRDLERFVDEAQRSVRLQRSVESGMRSSDSTRAWKLKAEVIQRALDNLNRVE